MASEEVPMSLRRAIDPASLILGVRVNIWTSALAFAVGATVAVLSRQPAPDTVS